MTTTDIATLHRRYVDLASRFKSAWTFHQFLQGIQKFFAEVEIGRYPSDFQEIHGTLKTVADNLSSSDGAKLSSQLDQVERQLGQMMGILSAADVRVSPTHLRQFFDRVKNFDEQILAQMVRFYLLTAGDAGLQGDRRDKVDFLVTRVSEEIDRVSSSYVLRDRTRLRELYQGFAAATGDLDVDEATLAAWRSRVDEMRRELAGLAGFEALTGSGFVARYREVKQQLGRFLFHPELLMLVVETNLSLKNKIRQYYHLEEQRVLDESHRILASEGQAGLGSPFEIELDEFRRSIEDFERKQRRDGVKLDDLALLRRQVAEIKPRLERQANGRSAGELETTRLEASASVPAASGSEMGRTDPVDPHLKEILEALEGTDNQASPKTVALSRDIYHLRLEPREVLAYRRLHVKPEGDPELEQFLLDAAAVRLRINQEAAEITELLDETAVTKDAPVFERARLTTRHADALVQRFGHFIDLTVQDGAFGEAQQLQLLRMRLIRDYSGLWLLVNRPSN